MTEYICPKCQGKARKGGLCTTVVEPLLWGTMLSDGYTDAGLCNEELEETDGIREEGATRD